MKQLIALVLAFMGLALPLAAVFYFADRRDKREKRDRATAARGRRK